MLSDDYAAAIQRLVDDGLDIKAATILIRNELNRDERRANLSAWADRLVRSRNAPIARSS